MKYVTYLTLFFLISCSTSSDKEETISEEDYHANLNQTTPLAFLLSLKKHPESMFTINGLNYDRDQFNFVMCNPISDSNGFENQIFLCSSLFLIQMK